MGKFISTKYNRGQIWSLDLLIAMVIFLIGIATLFYYAFNYSSQSKNQLNEFFYEGELASNLILSEENFGILSNGIVNQTKLNNFDGLDNKTKKNLLGVQNNFYFVMEGLEINDVEKSYVGIINTTQIDNIIKITRIAVYKNKPVKFELFVWK